jgi:Uma2 family endonuclease
MRLGCFPRARREGVRRYARTGETESREGMRLGCFPRARREGVRRYARTGDRRREKRDRCRKRAKTGYTGPVLSAQQLAPETPRPLRRSEYDQLVALGAFEGERVELLRGVIVRMSPHGPGHDAPLDRLTELLIVALGVRAKVRVQSAFVAADDSEPAPDLCVVPRREYDAAHPDRAFLIIEVAASSLSKDRNVKAPLYAESGVPEYWIVNLSARSIEVHSEPEADGYRSVQAFHNGALIQLRQFPDVFVKVDDVLLP